MVVWHTETSFAYGSRYDSGNEWKHLIILEERCFRKYPPLFPDDPNFVIKDGVNLTKKMLGPKFPTKHATLRLRLTTFIIHLLASHIKRKKIGWGFIFIIIDRKKSYVDVCE